MVPQPPCLPLGRQQKLGPCTPRRGCPSRLTSRCTGLPGPQGGHPGLGVWGVKTSPHTARPAARAEESWGLLRGPRARAGPAARQDLNQMAAAPATAGTAAALSSAGRRQAASPPRPPVCLLPEAAQQPAFGDLSPPPRAACLLGRPAGLERLGQQTWTGNHQDPHVRPPLTHSFIHASVRSLIHSLTRSLIHSVTHSCAHSFIPWLYRS